MQTIIHWYESHIEGKKKKNCDCMILTFGSQEELKIDGSTHMPREEQTL